MTPRWRFTVATVDKWHFARLRLLIDAVNEYTGS
jgi:hypothetical protein